MYSQKYLSLLSREYPNVQSASAKIIELSAILNLPKGTEYFFSDLHGENQAFLYQLKSASGMIKNKIDEIFGLSIDEKSRSELALLIYYPEKEIAHQKEQEKYNDEWIKLTVFRLLEVCKIQAEKFTRGNMRHRLPENYIAPVEELLHAVEAGKTEYFSKVMDAVIDAKNADLLIAVLCDFIKRLTVDRLHIIGDIFDRGPHADLILNELQKIPNIDIQWGNHDISWIGAAAGNLALIANVVRLGISYNNFDLLEDAYGINLRPLSEFAAKVYAKDPCEKFVPHRYDDNVYDAVPGALAAKMHKAIAVIQFKLECELIARHPEYHMEDRAILATISPDKKCVVINHQQQTLCDWYLPTVDPGKPTALTEEEDALMKSLKASFTHSEKLRSHVHFLVAKGGMYRTINNNLLFHGCVPLTKDGNILYTDVLGENCGGKEYFDKIDKTVRSAVLSDKSHRNHQSKVDFCWYLWCGPHSPLFGKDKMTAFERYFCTNESLYTENRNPYYIYCNQAKTCDTILREFCLEPDKSRIINGHVPVKAGENPVKAGGKLFVIDGGISKAYRSTTGIAGYTLIYSSHYIALAQHKPFSSNKNGLFIEEDTPIIQVVNRFAQRMMVKDTDYGQELSENILSLKALIAAYKSGQLKEYK